MLIQSASPNTNTRWSRPFCSLLRAIAVTIWVSLSPIAGFNFTISFTKSVVSNSFQQPESLETNNGIIWNPLSATESIPIAPGMEKTDRRHPALRRLNLAPAKVERTTNKSAGNSSIGCTNVPGIKHTPNFSSKGDKYSPRLGSPAIIKFFPLSI